MGTAMNKNTKAPAKVSKITAKAKPAAKAAPKNGNGNGHHASNGHSSSPRSALQGGEVPAERYAKDAKSVAARMKEKAEASMAQAANAIVRAEKAGIENTAVKKLRTALDHFEAAKKALA